MTGRHRAHKRRDWVALAQPDPEAERATAPPVAPAPGDSEPPPPDPDDVLVSLGFHLCFDREGMPHGCICSRGTDHDEADFDVPLPSLSAWRREHDQGGQGPDDMLTPWGNRE